MGDSNMVLIDNNIGIIMCELVSIPIPVWVSEWVSAWVSEWVSEWVKLLVRQSVGRKRVRDITEVENNREREREREREQYVVSLSRLFHSMLTCIL